MVTKHLSSARDHCLAPSRVAAAAVYGGTYDRLFPELPALDNEDAVLWELGRLGGPCDSGESDGDEARDVAAGWPSFGQFIAHDITADRSTLKHHADTTTLRNVRSPRINLECLYGVGPGGAPFLYDRDDPAKLLLGINDAGLPQDLPRNRQGVALLGDHRNDVHLVVSQLHVAMLKVHNGLVDRLREDGVPEGELYEEARRATTWHYQWVVLHDFLPRLVGDELMGELLAEGRRYYRPEGEPFIPLEFADGAYRYGHGQIRGHVRINAASGPVPFFPNLMGFRPVPAARVIDWAELFDLPGRPLAQRARKLDGRMSRSLINLPVAITGDVEVEAYHSLAVRDLQRGQGVGLPSGEAVARRIGVEPLTREQTGLAAGSWSGETPLWFYVLREADVCTGGERLGPVGGRIVAEVLLGLIDLDPESFRAVDPTWRPTLPAAGDAFTLADLLVFAA